MAEMELKSVVCPHFQMENINVESLDIREIMDFRATSMDTTEDVDKFVNVFWQKAREIESEELEKKILKRNKAEKCRRGGKVIKVLSTESSSDAFSKIQASFHSNCGSPLPVPSMKEHLRPQGIAKSGPLLQYESSPGTFSRDSEIADKEKTEVSKVNHEISGNFQDRKKTSGMGIEKKQTGKVKKFKGRGEKLKASLPKLRSGRCGRSETSASASSSSALTAIWTSFPYILRSKCSQVSSSEGGEQKIVKSHPPALNKSGPHGSCRRISSSKAEEIAEKLRAIWTAIKK